MEIEANLFAAELLMPKAILAKALGNEPFDIDDESAVSALARSFKVSPSSMRFRLGNCSHSTWKKPAMSFVFYDTETTGTKTAFDQILQFGAIRTDHELRELDRFEIPLPTPALRRAVARRHARYGHNRRPAH